MIRDLLSVGGLTLVSRVTGFIRDIILGAILGAGLANDAFVVAFKLPNHFRAIFGEGAFNAAYVPSYSAVLETEGNEKARAFSSQIFTLLLASQIALLAAAWLFMPTLVDLLAPGFRDDPKKFGLAVNLTRITFPYLLCITLVTLHTGTLNANRRFIAGAFAPVLLNLAMIAALALAFLFPDAAHAASWGVFAAGLLQLALVVAAARRAGVLEGLARPHLDTHVRQFFSALGPAVIGSAGIQIAIFADTIIGSMLPTGGLSSIYYADRLYQLPIGVIGIAAGTVLLPQMSRAFAASDRDGAFRAQNRTMGLTLALTAPFFIAFVTIADLIMRAAFVRGRFTNIDADASAAVLAAYSVGLLPVVLIAAARASFQSRGDTKTPMMIALAAIACNVALKIFLFTPFGAPGLAFATAVGAWINLLALVAMAWRGKWMQPDRTFGKVAVATGLASLALLIVAGFGRGLSERLAAHAPPSFAEITALSALGFSGIAVYGLVFVVAALVIGLPLSRLRPPKRIADAPILDDPMSVAPEEIP